MIEWSVLRCRPLSAPLATAHACTIDDMKVAVKVSTGTAPALIAESSRTRQPYPILPNPTQSY